MKKKLSRGIWLILGIISIIASIFLGLILMFKENIYMGELVEEVLILKMGIFTILSLLFYILYRQDQILIKIEEKFK